LVAAVSVSGPTPTPHWQAGIDALYALTPTTRAYGTVCPDFATIEADQEQVNVTRFEVSLRERGEPAGQWRASGQHQRRCF
jgi:hypothetical protein